MNLRLLVVGCFLTVLIPGCILLPGDDFVDVKGRVVDLSGNPYRNCVLEQYYEDDAERADWRYIEGDFNESFSFRGSYNGRFVIECKRAKLSYESKWQEVRKTDPSDIPVVDLGTIRLPLKD